VHVLVISTGDPETRASWSGITKSVVDQLRLDGHQVSTGNVEPRGADRYLAAAATFSPNNARWHVRYTLDRVPFSLRSRRAARCISAAGSLDWILQIGATFEPLGHGSIPYFCYCDSNIAMAERGRSTGHSHAASLSPIELDAILRRERAVYQNATGIFAIHERLRRSFIDDFQIPEGRTRAVYAGPNFDVAHVPPRTSLPGGRPPTVLFVGGQWERKGGDVLLAGFERVRSTIPAARLIVVGPPESVRGANVEWLGYLNKDTPEGWRALVDAYQRADVFCLPTRFEPFGIAFLEAMWFGLPCIGTDVWAVPEIVIDGDTGFTVPPEDPDQLADRLCSLLTDRKLAAAMGQAGRRRVKAVFTWPAVTARMMELVAPAVAARRATGG